MKNKKHAEEPNQIINFSVLLLMTAALVIVLVFEQESVKTNTIPAVSAKVESSLPVKPTPTPAEIQTDGVEIVFLQISWIYYLNTSDKSAPRKLVQGDFPALSPDKKQIVYRKAQNFYAAESVLMLLDLASGESTELTKIRGYVNYPHWSPAGNLILFVSWSDNRMTLEKISPDGTGRQSIARSGNLINDILSPVWAGNGKSVYFHDMSNLFRVSLDGTILEKTALAEFTGDAKTITSTDWFMPSPKDENLLAFTQSVEGTPLFEQTFGEPNTALFLYDRKKRERKRITPVDLLATDPVWSPDGVYIYFTGYYDRAGRAPYPFKIFRIKPDTSDLIQIGPGECPSL